MEANSKTKSGLTAGCGNEGAPTRFTPLFNDAFLRIFGSADSEPVTKPLLNAVLRKVGLEELDRIESISTDASLPGGVECKTPRLDVVVVCDDGRLIDLEAQRRKVDVGAKSLLYAAKLLVENTPKGKDDSYRHMPHVVAVVLLEGSTVVPDPGRFISVCKMRWDAERPLGGPLDGPDNIVVVLAELDKVRARYNDGEHMDEVLTDESLAWLYLLAIGYEDPEEVNAIMKSFPTMEEFATRYGIALGDPDLKRAYDRYWESELEYNSIMEAAREDGREEGRKEGHEEAVATLRAAGFEEAAALVEHLAGRSASR